MPSHTSYEMLNFERCRANSSTRALSLSLSSGELPLPSDVPSISMAFDASSNSSSSDVSSLFEAVPKIMLLKKVLQRSPVKFLVDILSGSETTFTSRSYFEYDKQHQIDSINKIALNRFIKQVFFILTTSRVLHNYIRKKSKISLLLLKCFL